MIKTPNRLIGNFMESQLPPVINLGQSLSMCVSELITSREKRRYNWDGCYILGVPVPEFQRPFVWSDEQQTKFIESIFLGLPIGSYTINGMIWEDNKPHPMSGWLLDGRQRLSTIQNFINDKVKIFGDHTWSRLNEADRWRFENTIFTRNVVYTKDVDHAKMIYNLLALGGTPHTEQERAK